MTTSVGWLAGRRDALVRGVAIALALGACSDDHGILIEITRDDDVPAAIDRLTVFAGTDVAGRDGNGYADQAPDDDIALGGGRDLAADPYRLLLEPGAKSADHAVMVAALAFQGEALVGFGALDRPATFVDGAIVAWPLVLRAGIPAGFVADGGCLSWLDAEGQRVVLGQPPDQDCDGFVADDCDDLDPLVNPGASDVCGNVVDDDCDGTIDEDVDEDLDTFTTCGGDCDDTSTLTFPGALEVCDGADNDCDGSCDGAFDADGDAFTTCGTKRLDGGTCESDPSYLDCDDGAQAVHPFAEETCDGVDNDCSGACDDDEALDPDGDRYTSCGSVTGICHLDDATVDCKSENGAVHPAALELCNGVDDDCDGALLTQAPCYTTSGGSGCSTGVRSCDDVNGGALGACEALAGESVPEALCEAYAACEDAGADDPYGCANDGAASENYTCLVAFQPPAGQCPGDVADLMGEASPDCSFEIVGGTEQGDFRVGFVVGGGLEPTGPCDATFKVELIRKPPSPRSIAVVQRDVDVVTLYDFQLVGEPVEECVPPSSLTCTEDAP